MDENGSYELDEQQICGIAERYFQGIFFTSHPTKVEKVLTLVDSEVTEEMNQELNRPFYRRGGEECMLCDAYIKIARPGWYVAIFLLEILANSGWRYHQSSALNPNSGHILNKMNFTHILLILKIKNP